MTYIQFILLVYTTFTIHGAVYHFYEKNPWKSGIISTLLAIVITPLLNFGLLIGVLERDNI